MAYIQRFPSNARRPGEFMKAPLKYNFLQTNFQFTLFFLNDVLGEDTDFEEKLTTKTSPIPALGLKDLKVRIRPLETRKSGESKKSDHQH